MSSSQPIVCVPKRTHRVSRRTHRVCPQNSVSSLFRNSTLETVFRPFPNFTIILGGRFGYFIFFSARGGGRGSLRRLEGRGDRFVIENPSRGGGAEGPGGCLRQIGEFWGVNVGGAKYFFRGRNIPKGPNLEKFQDRLKIFQSRLKISISLEIFNPDFQNSPQKIGVWWVARLKMSSSLENFKIWALGISTKNF